MNDAISTGEAAQIIGCTRRHVVKLFHAGLLAGQWWSDVIQISRSSALAYTPARTGPRARQGEAIEHLQPYARSKA